MSQTPTSAETGAAPAAPLASPAGPGAPARKGPPALLWQRLEAEPWRHDFYWAMRRIECHYTDRPRLGLGLRPVDEPVRLGQEPALDFAPASLSGFKPGDGGRPPRMEVRFFGLFGPNGPLPLHLTDYARERLLHHGDRSFARFADVFHHRLLLLFYRAWAQAQPTVSLDRPRDDRFASYVGSLFGIGSAPLQHRDALPDNAKLHFAGLLVRQVRNAEGLQAFLQGYFGLPTRVEQFVGHWMNLPQDQRTRLHREPSESKQLGVGAVVGRRVWDRQHKFRIHLGPLTMAQYLHFLPGGEGLEPLVAAVRQYIGFELDWDVRLILRADEVPRGRLGMHSRLGWTTWGGPRRNAGDAEPLTIHPEQVRSRRRRAAEGAAAAGAPTAASDTNTNTDTTRAMFA
ncbi:type VI secretion system baseplate subunit TssG [Aquabacterium sp. A7-Y]|uniref:type VI secretion system baseplate subunit TssG n=1 Tax=Aquabacterium sp. A7-Y TaxID=1349605 RepID=UPI00223C9671|nr:type VI secretion system baseplate subunit TssG [Aquabacterium sp. A7-Y]MCW7540750.1 type VI secretion system baseplate subunit TssG [Aquabacterium sp. A7-Y]